MNKLLSSLLSRVEGIARFFSPWLLFVSVAAFAWFLASTVWLVVAPPKVYQLDAVALQQRQSGVNVSGGVFSVFESPKPKQTQQPISNSNFKLEGVFIASPRASSAALISANGSIRRYRMNTAIEDSDYKLVDVSWNQAVIEDSAGTQVELTLHEAFDLNAGADKEASSRVTAVATPSPRPTPTSVLSKPSIKEQMDTMFETAVSELRQNPAGYLSKMGVMATGDGYEVTSGMNSQLRSSIGLKPGDKVISVNGQSVGQPQQDAQLLAEVQQSGNAEIQVQRGSQVITVRQQF